MGKLYRLDAVQNEIDLSIEGNLQKNPVLVHRSGNQFKQTASAVVKFANLNQGGSPSAGVRKAMKKIGAKGDDAGHLIAKMLGGPGNDVNNFVPMNLSINRGRFRVFETKIRDAIKKNKTWEARLTLDLTYNPSGKYPKRPDTILFVCNFYQGGTFKGKLQKSFSNPVKK